MKSFFKKLISYSLVFVVFIQFSFVAPPKAQAGSLDTVKTVLGLIEDALGPSWPLPIKATEIFALIGIIEKCTDTSDAGLTACVNGAGNDPLIGPMLETEAGMENIKLGLAIYLDIKNSDYVQLIKDGGKPIGCAAAAILTGFDVCGALDELLAIAGAVGDAAEYAFSWLDDLDVALFGQVPHMNQDQYFVNRWKPYVRGYAELAYKGTPNNAITPYLPPYAYQNCGSYASCGLYNKTLNDIYNECTEYYKGFKDGNGGAICENNKTAFIDRVNLLINTAKAANALAPVLQGVLDGQNKIYNDKMEAFKESLKTKFPEFKDDVKDQAKYDKYYWDKYGNFLKNIEKKVGKITGGSYCLDPMTGSWECISIDKGDGTCCNTVAAKTYANLYETKFQTTPLDASNKAISDSKEEMENYYKWMMADIEHFWQMKREQTNSSLMWTFINDAKSKLYALKGICKTLTHYKDFGGNLPFVAACSNSEPLVSCTSKIDSIANQKISESDTQATNTYIQSNKPAVESCLKASETVTKEWQRMDNLYHDFIDGWYQYYQDHFKGNYKAKNKGEKVGSVPKEKMADSLEIEYTNCASDHMDEVIKKAIDDSSGKIAFFTGKPVGSLATQATKTVLRTGVSKYKPGGSFEAQAPVIAEGFCKDKGLGVVNYFNQPAPESNFDDDGRDKDMKIKAKNVADSSGCSVYEFTDSQGKHSDEFHLICDSKEKYDKCFTGLGGGVRPSAAKCSSLKGSISNTMVVGPCCEANFQTAVQEIVNGAKAADAKDLTSGAKGAMIAAGAAAAKNAANEAATKTAMFKVTATAGTGGTVAPTSQSVALGKTTAFTITASTGFKTKAVTGCGIKNKMGNLYETEAITADCSVNATFEKTTVAMPLGNARQLPTAPGTTPAATTIAPGAIQPRTGTASSTTIHMIPVQPVAPKRK